MSLKDIDNKNYMYKLFFLLLALGLTACSPKTVTTISTTPAGKAPVIPIPQGDVRKTAPKAGEAPRIQIGKAETFKLDNGLTVILVENHKLPQVSYRVFVDYDPVLEGEATGYVDLMGILLAKGTTKRSKDEIDEEIDFLGASLQTDAWGGSASGLSKHADRLLAILSDVLLHPGFSQTELEKSLVQLKSNLKSDEDDANAIAANVASVLKYGEAHPYGEVVRPATLDNIKLDKIRNHYATFFKPNISYLVIVGDISREKAEMQAKKYFGSWKPAQVPKTDHGLPRPPEQTRVSMVHKADAVQSVIRLTYPVELQPGSADVIRARAMNTLLGGYFTSRLNMNLRERHGWTYGAGSRLSSDPLIGDFSAAVGVRNEVTDSALGEIIFELDRLRNEKVTPVDLQVVKNVITGQFAQDLENPATAAEFALNTARFKLPADYYEQYLSVLASVKPEEILLMAKKYLHPDRAHILVVGDKTQVEEKLKRFGADGTVHYYDFYGNPVTYNQIPVPEGLDAQAIIGRYLEAVGGKSLIETVRDLYTEGVLQLPGPALQIKTWQKGNNRLLYEMSMNGQTMSQRLYDGKTGTETGMGDARRNLEGQDLGDLKELSRFVKEYFYLTEEYTLTIKKAEQLGERRAVVLEVMRPDGKQQTEYYDLDSGLKIREISFQPGMDGKPATVITDFSDYRAVNGLLFPFQTTLTGLFPSAVTYTLSEIKMNQGIEDAVFQIK